MTVPQFNTPEEMQEFMGRLVPGEEISASTFAEEFGVTLDEQITSPPMRTRSIKLFPDLDEKAHARADRLQLPFSAYVRRLIEADLRGSVVLEDRPLMLSDLATLLGRLVSDLGRTEPATGTTLTPGARLGDAA